MQEKEEKRLYPGDVGYQGGIFHTTVYIDEKAKDVKTVKDSNGMLSMFLSWKRFWEFSKCFTCGIDLIPIYFDIVAKRIDSNTIRDG